MNIVQLILFLAIITGIILVIIALIYMTKNNKKYEMDKNKDLTINPSNNNYLEAKYGYEEQTNILVEFQEVKEFIDEFKKYSESIFKEIDEKHDELIKLYREINEDKKIVKSFQLEDAIISLGLNKEESNTDVDLKEEKYIKPVANSKEKFLNSKNMDIINLSKAGLSVSDIAKRLNMGQGEVQIILDLGKVR